MGDFSWPGGVQAAACLTFDLDAESALLSQALGAADRLDLMAHQAYGPLVGIPRLLQLLKRYGISATFFVPGYTASLYPEVVRTIAAAGHELGHHGYLHESVAGLSPDIEAGHLRKGLNALWDVAAVRPAGYRAPFWQLNYHTPSLLLKAGFRYDSSLMDSDVPYRLAVDEEGGAGTLIEVPVQWALDDWEQYAFMPGHWEKTPIESTAKALEIWTLELNAVHAEGGCFVLTCHPFLSGRPSRAAVLETLIEHMQALPGLWVAPVIDVVAHVETLELSPRRHRKPPEPHF